MPIPKANSYYIEVLGKALDILDTLGNADKPRLSLQEISNLTTLNKNTVFRALYTLAERGYVVKHGHNYELGSRLLYLGYARLRRQDLLSITGPYMDALRDRFRETVNLGVLDGGQIRYVDVRESPERFRLAERIGGSDHLHSTALGKAHLAWLPLEAVKRLLKEQQMPRLTPATITSLSAMKKELDHIRNSGYAVDREESMPGAFCVAVPILNAHSAPLAALSISGPTTRFGEPALPAVSQALQEAAAEIRARLGHA